MVWEKHSCYNDCVKLTAPKLSIASKIYLALLALALGLGAVAGIAWLDAGQQALARAQQDTDEGLDGFQSDFDRATRDLIALGTSLSGQKGFLDQLQARDKAGLAKQIEPWTGISIADTIAVVDTDGIMLAEYPAEPRPPEAKTSSNLPGVKEALAGKRSIALLQDQSERWLAYGALPVYNGDSRPAVGALVLAFYVDGSFLQYRSRKPGQQIAFVYQDQISLITLTDRQGLAWRAGPAPEQVVLAQKSGIPSEFLTLQTDIGPYLFRFKPLSSSTGSTVAMYGVGVSMASANDVRWSLFRTVGVGLLLVAIGTAVLGLVFIRTLTSPIRALGRAAQSMTDGDLSSPVRLARTDELGVLSEQLERMRQQLQEAFRSITLEKSRSAAAIESMGVAAIITDHRLEIRTVNPTAAVLLRMRESALVGKDWRQVFDPSSNSDNMAFPLRLQGAGPGAGKHNLTLRGQFRMRECPQVVVDVISTQVEVGGEPAGFVHILYDASVQEELVRAKDDFIMNVAHELRGPLASLRASVEVLMDDYAGMSQQELAFMIKTMQRGVFKFHALVENLVDLGNIQAGRFRVRPTPTALSAIVEDAIDQMNPVFQARRQTTDIKVEDPAVLVLADRPRIVQVVINLLTNASKYSPEGSSIALSVSSQEAFAVVAVTDRGPGIPPEEQAGLFRRFFRTRRAEEAGQGIGLGLALVKEIIAGHGGQIDVKSQVGEGTTFRFTLPKVDRAQALPAPVSSVEIR